MNITYDFTGKTAIVTGGRRGIGKALALALFEAGATVTVISKSNDRSDLPASIEYVQCDLSDRTQREKIIKPCDILINNAGISMTEEAIHTSVADFSNIVEVNLTAVFDLSCQAYKAGCKRIIILGSISSLGAARNISAYASSKHALVGLTKVLSDEWAKDGTTVNCLAPGFIMTDMLRLKEPQIMLGRIPMGRFGMTADVVGPALFLASDASRYMTGSTILVDGGWLGR